MNTIFVRFVDANIRFYFIRLLNFSAFDWKDSAISNNNDPDTTINSVWF